MKVYIAGAWVIGIVVFLGVWIYAIADWGFLIGLALGWFPAMIAGAIAAVLWPLLLALALVLAFYIGSH